ncbi:ATP-binding protein [Nodosilinea sp. E11]|uniref:ATP-binding protein n=1 Tax=Nodosilinea sp. E11 TaxID=3037479 RepID=UPI002934DBCF|nr:ATP-binding protein [Nodosilinea sp. E11]WOD41672.1 ATP-binding protein [Nodosilinea sp. E11]
MLDLLLKNVPAVWQAEVRLGLQEALVNAAKHGNGLDPTKCISVKYTASTSALFWVIADQGRGFRYPCGCDEAKDSNCVAHPGECGRGLYILYQVFDEVAWYNGGRELHLGKVVRQSRRLPLIR